MVDRLNREHILLERQKQLETLIASLEVEIPALQELMNQGELHCFEFSCS